MSMAREASALSLVTCHGGVSRRGIDPVGETSNVPDTPLGTRHFVLTDSHPPTGDVHGRPKRRAQEANQAQEASPAQQSPERSLPVPVPASTAALELINPDAAGIDVHSNMHMVCVPADRDPNPVRQFGANTADLHEIVAWLKNCRIQTVALESTGVYWIPLFELLESEGFEVRLVEPGQLALRGAPEDRCARRPVDPAAAFLRPVAGVVPASRFRAGAAAYWRQREMQVRYAAHHVQHMQKALEQMNLKLTEVVSDITGLTGMSIIDAIQCQ